MQTDRTPRSALKPYKRRGKWYARGAVPIRSGDRITRARKELSAGDDCSTKAQCQAFCDRLNAMFEERALSSRRPLTFAKAMDNYLGLGKPVPKYAEKLVEHFGHMLCSDIDNTAMVEATRAFFPNGSGAPNINRNLYTPVIAVLRLASIDKACEPPRFVRPEGYAEHPEIAVPENDEWFVRVMPELSPKAQAAVMLLTVHGRRVGELLSRSPKDFDPEAGTLYLGKTKNGTPVMVRLHPRVTELMLQMPGWQTRERLFGYKEGTPGVNRINLDIRKACKRAGVDYFSTHALGRHRFAHRMLDAGYSLQHVKDSGGWKTLKVLSDRYGHRAHTEYTETVHQVGSKVTKLIELGDRVGMELQSTPTETQ
jgi:integrase